MFKKYRFLIIFGFLLILFTTNPNREQHEKRYAELLMETIQEKSEDRNLFSSLLAGLEHALTSDLKTVNYHLCSLSYIKSRETGKIQVVGIGFLHQVMAVSSPEEINNYIIRNKRLTGSLEYYKPEKGKKSPFGWRLTVNPKALELLGID